jgi:glycosyltransferase involved in cell wall biosynthesis
MFLNGINAYLLSRSGTPYISEIHHVEGYPRAVTRREQVYHWLAKRYIPFAARHAAAIRVVNHHEIPGLLRSLGVPEEKILILPSLYLDFESLYPAPELRRYDVLFVGRLASNKGIFTLLDAIQTVKQAKPDVSLGIRGSGALKAEIDRYIAKHNLNDNVAFIPHVEGNLAQLYNLGRMLVCASTSEGGPRVTVEAMACGVPVISTPVGVMPDIITDGENGLLFKGDELAQKILLLLEDDSLLQKLAEKGRQMVQQFEAEKIIDNYASAYKQISQTYLG